LVYLLGRSGITTGVDLDKLIATGEWLQQALGRTVPGMLLKAGNFPGAARAA
jgi:hydroxymethylglutaryl-CoA lyase